MSLSDSQVRALKASEKRQKKSCGSSSGLYVVVETKPPLYRKYIREKEVTKQLWKSLQTQGWKPLKTPAWGAAADV